MAPPYDWPLVWDLNGFTCILEPRSFLAPRLSTHSALLSLLLDLGSHFTRALIASLLAPYGHFPGLLLATLTGVEAGHTTLCVQGIFGSGKTYSASLLLVVLSSILNVNCVLTAEPNLPSQPLSKSSILFCRTPPPTFEINMHVGWPIKLNPLPPSTAPLKTALNSYITTQLSAASSLPKVPYQGTFVGSTLHFKVSWQVVALLSMRKPNTEARQDPPSSLAFLTVAVWNYSLETKSRPAPALGANLQREVLLTKLAMKSVGFLNSPFPSLPSEFVEKLAKALRPLAPFSTLTCVCNHEAEVYNAGSPAWVVSFFPALPSEYETLSVNNWKYAKESNSLEQTCKK